MQHICFWKHDSRNTEEDKGGIHEEAKTMDRYTHKAHVHIYSKNIRYTRKECLGSSFSFYPQQRVECRFRSDWEGGLLYKYLGFGD